MTWVSLSFEVEAAGADALADALFEQGALAVDIADADAGTPRELSWFSEPGEPGAGTWRRNRLSALFPDHSDAPQALVEACNATGMPVPPDLQVLPVSDQDWVRATQQQFAPIEISPRLWIVPSWCEPPVPGALVLRLDPGLAFGTGSHPTTAQCLRWLDEHLERGQSVLDYGCGSGILAIAAAKLGARRVTGTDIDPDALAASRDNARTNAVEVDWLMPEAVQGCFDVVVANILANPLQVLAPLLTQRTRPGGRIVLAGILDAQAAAVTQAYAPWFILRPAWTLEGWTCVSGERKL